VDPGSGRDHNPIVLSPRAIVSKGIRAWKRIVYPWYVRYPGFIRRPEPRFRLYCVGLGKTGTHSVANLFKEHYRSDHEVGAEMDIRMVRAMLGNEEPPMDPVEYIRRRDRYLRLEVDSNNLLRYFLDPLLAEFPDARFVVTIRDCYSWVDSVFNNRLARRISPGWKSLRALTFQTEGIPFPPEEQVLADRGLIPLEACFSTWARENSRTIGAIPANRLLIVRTDQLGDSLDRIAEFVGVPPEHLDRRRSHAYRAPKKFGLLEQIDQEHLIATAERCCGELMREHFPEIRGPKDSIRDYGS